MTIENDSDDNQLKTQEDDWEKEAQNPINVNRSLISDILGDDQRRRVLILLSESGGESTIEDLAERIASLENKKPIGMLSSSEKEDIHLMLYQIHLPKLEDADLISFNKNDGDVRLTESGKSVFSKFLDQESDPTVPNSGGARSLRFLNTISSFIVLISGSIIVAASPTYTKELVYATPIFILIILSSCFLEKWQFRRGTK